MDKNHYELIILGGGPAGLTAGLYASRARIDHVLVEKGAPGGQVLTTDWVDNYPGFPEGLSGFDLMEKMTSHAKRFDVNILTKEVASLDVSSGETRAVLFSDGSRITCDALIIATGASPLKLGIQGEEEYSGRGVSYCATCDGQLFKNRKVIIVGGGNSAATEALYLKNVGVDVTMVHRKDTLKAQDVLVQSLVQNNIPILFNTEVTAIDGRHNVESVDLLNNQTGETSRLEVDGVFMAIGYNPTNDLAEKLGIELTEEGYIRHDNYRTNVPGIYTAGDVAGGFKQIVTAAGQGSEAATVIFEDLIDPYWKK